MKKETKWISALYIASLIVVLIQQSSFLYQTIHLVIPSGGGRGMIPFTITTMFGLFIPILLAARATQVIKAGGLNYLPPQSKFVSFFRRLSLTFLTITVAYYIVAYGIALVVPYGAYFMFFKYLMPPVATMLLVLEFTRISSIDSVQVAT